MSEGLVSRWFRELRNVRWNAPAESPSQMAWWQ